MTYHEIKQLLVENEQELIDTRNSQRKFELLRVRALLKDMLIQILEQRVAA